jgi:hypothetical protein
MKTDAVVRAGSRLNQQSCFVGAYCSHAILTAEIGVYLCPFGECFKKLESQKRGGS